jgi:hypothetical protein
VELRIVHRHFSAQRPAEKLCQDSKFALTKGTPFASFYR